MLQEWFDNCDALAKGEAGVALVLAALRSRSGIWDDWGKWEIARLGRRINTESTAIH